MQEHHGEYEPTSPKDHWSGWCAAKIAARQEGKTPEEAATIGKLHIEALGESRRYERISLR
jgi:hypothetical protein